MSFQKWVSVPGFEGKYEVSDQGNVRSLRRVIKRRDGFSQSAPGRMLKPYPLPHSGYLQLTLGDGGKGRRYYVHRLVLEAFVGPAPEGHEACHNNGVPSDNRLENLRWGTRGENNRDAVAHGTHGKSRKTHCPRGHRLKEPNLVPSRKPHRICLACSRAQSSVKNHPELKPEFQELSDRYYAAIVAPGKPD